MSFKRYFLLVARRSKIKTVEKTTRLYKSNPMALAALVLNVFIEPLFYQKNKNPSSAWSLVGVSISVYLVAAASTDFN